MASLHAGILLSFSSLDWLDGYLIQSLPVPEHGLTLRFVPESADTLSRYDLWAGRVVRLASGG